MEAMRWAKVPAMAEGVGDIACVLVERCRTGCARVAGNCVAGAHCAAATGRPEPEPWTAERGPCQPPPRPPSATRRASVKRALVRAGLALEWPADRRLQQVHPSRYLYRALQTEQRPTARPWACLRRPTMRAIRSASCLEGSSSSSAKACQPQEQPRRDDSNNHSSNNTAPPSVQVPYKLPVASPSPSCKACTETFGAQSVLCARFLRRGPSHKHCANRAKGVYQMPVRP